MPVIEIEKDKGEAKLKEIAEEIDRLIKNNKLNWVLFKRKIIAQYIINEYRWKYKEYELDSLYNKILNKISIENKDADKILKRLKNYCMGIWVVEKKD